MRSLHRLAFVLTSLLVLMVSAGPARAADFPLKEGDIWVMAGDSITAQHLHSNYFEAFCFARYPPMKFAFRNSGVGGHTIPSTLARFDYDIAAWKPTVVSVELGMNDQGGTPTKKFVANMGMMVERIKGIHARPVIFTASPINNGGTSPKFGGNQRLHEYAVDLKEFSMQQNLPFADQFHMLIDVWGKNKPREIVANSLNMLKAAAKDDSLAGAEHLRAFLDAQEKSPTKLISMQGDAVHPGPPGQLMMAAALLKALGADGFVSSASLDAQGKLVESKGCTVDNIKVDGSVLSFDRLDERLPFPIPDDARVVMTLDPTILELSQYTLKVAGLDKPTYLLSIDKIPVAELSSKDLAAGVNLTAFGVAPSSKQPHPITVQSNAILNAVSAKEGIVGSWRGLSKQAIAPGAPADLKTKLAELTTKVEAADARIREAAMPKKHTFTLAPAK